MIAAQVGRAIGTAVDWSLIHLLAAVSDRVEGRGADCYRRADALADMEAGREVWEAGEIAKAVDLMNAETKAMARTMRVPMSLFLEPDEHGFSGECPTAGSSCGCGRSAAVTTPAADNTTDCGCGSGTNCPNTCPDDGVGLVDSMEAAYHYHAAHRLYQPSRDGDSLVWVCEGCSWTGPTEQAHARHRFQVLADMKAATNRVAERLGGAS